MNINKVENQAKKVMEESKEHVPLALLVKPTKPKPSVIMSPLIFRDDEEKKVLLKRIRDFVQKEKITKYWVIMETWVSSNIHVSRPSRDINREEALIISEFSKENPNGKVVVNLFERKNGKIIWTDRKSMDSSKSSELMSRWNFFLEYKTTEEWNEIQEKQRIKDIIRRIKEHGISDEQFEKVKTAWEKDHGEIGITKEQAIKILIKIAKEGKIGFKNGIIPDDMKGENDD